MNYNAKKYMRKFHHIGFVVKDINRSIDFYVNVLGFSLYDKWKETPSEVKGGMGVNDAGLELAQVEGYGCMIEFLSYTGVPSSPIIPEPNQITVGHPCFLVNNLKEFVQELKHQGIPILGEIVELPMSRWVHIIDPDGVHVEIMENVESDPYFSDDERKQRIINNT